MSNEFEEVTDFKKIALLGIVIAVGAVASMYFITPESFSTESISEFLWQDMGNIGMEDIFDVEVPKQIVEQADKIITEKEQTGIRVNYTKYLDFGISHDDILDIQSISCSDIENDLLLSTDPKFTLIFEERRAEC